MKAFTLLFLVLLAVFLGGCASSGSNQRPEVKAATDILSEGVAAMEAYGKAKAASDAAGLDVGRAKDELKRAQAIEKAALEVQSKAWDASEIGRAKIQGILWGNYPEEIKGTELEQRALRAIKD